MLPAGTAADDVRRLVDQLAAAGGGTVDWWVEAATDDDDDVAAELGFTRVRDVLQLRCRLPAPPPPADLAVRPFRPGEDDDAWLAVNNRAFAWHPDQGGWDDARLREKTATAWFDPAGFLLHEEGGQLVAFCWTKVHDQTVPPMGEIYVIGVDPDHHGRGLGRALTLAGLDHLHRVRGLDVGMLYVEADNHAALRLYDALGFAEHHRDRKYRRTVRTAG